jgi:prephenate dehydratase
MTTGSWLEIEERCPSAIATLGPAGTSSEVAARAAWRVLSGDSDGPVLLHDTYEQAADSLRSATASHLVVANAYAQISTFYMDERLALASAFVLDTPPYGIAGHRGRPLPPRVRIASHPAPVPLIEQLLPDRFRVQEVVLTTSTSAAARAVGERTVHLALTTQPAAAGHGLEFISPARTIRMLWSVFVTARAGSS